MTDAYRLLLLRHGESAWNDQGLFTGWVDVGLSERGTHEAISAGQLLAARDLPPDVVHTSLLSRAIRTTQSWHSRQPTASGSRCAGPGC